MSFNLPDYIIVFLICSFVPLAAGILGILYSNMREKEFIPSPEYLAWQTTAAEIGLNEEETLHYNKIVAEKSRWSIVGNYRSREIRIFQGSRSSHEESPPVYYTDFKIQLEKPAAFELHLKKHGFLGSRTDIKVGDPELIIDSKSKGQRKPIFKHSLTLGCASKF